MSNQVLITIEGVLTELKTQQAAVDSLKAASDRAAGGLASVGLALEGMAGAGASALLSAGDMADTGVLFTCSVGDKKVLGFFSEASFRTGDVIRVVGTDTADGLSALAIQRTSDATLWMFPHGGRGTVAYRRFCWKWIPALSVLAPMLLFVALQLFAGRGQIDLVGLLLAVVPSSALAAAIGFGVARRFTQFAAKTDEALRGLGFKNPESMDLPAISRAACRDLPQEQRLGYYPYAQWIYRYQTQSVIAAPGSRAPAQ